MATNGAIERALLLASGRPLTTGEAARLTGLSSPKALRGLEARGVVEPSAALSTKGPDLSLTRHIGTTPNMRTQGTDVTPTILGAEHDAEGCPS